jgi:hypothetical protein
LYDAGGIDLAHGMVHCVGDKDRAVGADGDVAGRIELGRGGRPAVPRVACGVVAGDGADGAVVINQTDDVVGCIGNDDAIVGVQVDAPRRRRSLALGGIELSLHRRPAVAGVARRADAHDGVDRAVGFEQSDAVVGLVRDQNVAHGVDHDRTGQIEDGHVSRPAVASEIAGPGAGQVLDQTGRQVQALHLAVVPAGDDHAALIVERDVGRMVELLLNGYAIIGRPELTGPRHGLHLAR